VTDSDEQEAVMVRYLLGLSTEEERAYVEERYFSDGEYFDHLLAVEDSLIDDFVTGRMPADRRTAFRESFALRHDDIRFAASLFQATTKKKLDAELAPEPKHQMRGRKWMPFASPRLAALAVSIVALVLLIMSITLFFINKSIRNKLFQSETGLAELKEATQEQLNRERRQRELSERELETERNKRIEAESLLQKRAPAFLPNEASDFKKIILGAAFLSRGARGTAREIRLPDNVRWVRFEIPVKTHGEYESYRVSIKLAGERVIFERGSLRLTGTSSNLVVTVPASELRQGDYIITLVGARASGAPPDELEQYSLRIIP
jgi:hypothetical protein